jgi:hypothetical protein
MTAGIKVPAAAGAVPDAIRWTEELIKRIDERWPAK